MVFEKLMVVDGIFFSFFDGWELFPRDHNIIVNAEGDEETHCVGCEWSRVVVVIVVVGGSSSSSSGGGGGGGLKVCVVVL